MTISILAQNPTYLCELRNDTLTDAKTFEFEVYLLRTGSTVFEYTSMQMGININPGIVNAGIISASFVAGSDLKASQVFTPIKLSFNSSQNCIIVTGVPGPGTTAGTIISNTNFGTKICRIRLTNTVNFGSVSPNLIWSFSLSNGYQTKVNAYVPSATDITIPASHTTNNLINFIFNKPITAQSLTGNGSYCTGSAGVLVGLANSEIGVTYTLYKNGVTTNLTLPGTGSSISFPAQTSGTYTVNGIIGNQVWGVTFMTGSAIITENPTVASVNVAANVNPFVPGSTIIFTATPIGGGLAPAFQWYKNNTLLQLQNGIEFTDLSMVDDQVYVVMTPDNTCVTGTITSNTVTMVRDMGTSLDPTKMSIDIYSRDKNILVTCSEKVKQVCIYNTLGTMIKMENNVTGLKTFYMNDYPNEYYFVKVVTDNNVYTQKVLLK